MSSPSPSPPSEASSADLGDRRTTLVLVTGSRTWRLAEDVWSRLDSLLAERGHLTVIHGKASKGVDLFAHIWAEHHEKVCRDAREWPWPADWKNLGRKAGIVRNDEMARLGADYCLAWIHECTKIGCPRPMPHGSHGASDCVARARTYGVRNIELVESWTQEAVPDPDLL